MTARLPIRTACLAAIASLLAAASAFAADLSADVEQLFPVPNGGRNGGVAAIGGSTMERIDAEGAKPGMIKLAGKKAPVVGAWWFPGHLPMTAEQARVGQADAHVSLDVESSASVSTTLTIQWRGTDGAAGEEVKSQPVTLSPGKPTRVELAVPKPADGQKLGGFILKFDKPGEYRIRKLAITEASQTLVEAIETPDPRKAGPIAIRGQAVPEVKQVTLRFVAQPRPAPSKEVPDAKPVEKTVPVTNGKFEFTANATELMPGFRYKVTAEPQGKADAASPAQSFFLFPAFGDKRCPPIKADGTRLTRDGKPFGFVGVNYTRMNLGLGNESDYQLLAHDVMQMKRWGVRAVRLPIDIALIQPAPGLFPDDPKYAETLKSYKLDPRYLDQIEYFVQLAGDNGIYTIFDWHGMPIDPYRYFQGGRPSERDSGKPGTAIAYLAASNTKAGEFDMSNPLHVKTLLDSHRWVAKRFKGNPNVLAIEIPFNEPHDTFMAVEANWRRIVDASAKAVAEGDPERLTFTLGPSYSHNNLLPSVTWLAPDRAAGAAPHFYQANGPVPVRPDAKSFKSPWLARDVEASLGWSFPAVMLPLSGAPYPIYNGESGLHGHDSLLASFDKLDAATTLMEAQLVQEYATGMVGRLEWTLWGNEQDFEPYVEIYRKHIGRFAPVYEAGTIDRAKAQVAFVQDSEAAPSANGHNFACVPFAKAALDVHLPLAHYLTDEQFRYVASAEISVGLEQVVSAAGSLPYKAIVVDRRNLDPKVEQAIRSLKSTPVLWLDKADDLDAKRFAEFLEKAGVGVDTKTPREIQLAVGPQHLIAYRRLKGGASRIFPKLDQPSEFKLVDEAGKTVFTGTAAKLASDGIDVELPPYRSQIFRIVGR